ncbi:DNA-3-methyladenine glycosylase [Propionibacterium sp.]|uniref:DNA-3-methyladenine glycosylase n=1 Tax=Propionibacterium sp. TaxID=1977903 RepID=UPI0039E7BAE2
MLDFDRPADQLAPLLLGGFLRKAGVVVRLTEVEAYLGEDDPASHAFRGNHGRAAVMFGPSGRMYVYVSYGIHRAGNIVCSPAGQASAVLLRAGEIVDGLAVARARRAFPAGRPDALLAKGPGNLGRALGLDLADNGAVLGTGADEFEFTESRPAASVLAGERIGISRAVGEQLRFWLPGEPTVSARKTGSAFVPRSSAAALQPGSAAG